MIRPPRFVAAAIALIAFAPPLSSQSEKPGPRELPLREGVREAWAERNRLIEGQLRAGECDRARGAADAMLREVTESLSGGEGAGALLASPVALRALAWACLDDPRQALWDYHTAQALSAGVVIAMAEELGEIGVKLTGMLRAETEAIERLKAEYKAIEDFDQRKLSPPERIGEVEVFYPKSLRGAMRTGVALVHAYLDTDGYLHQPVISPESTPNAVFHYAALNANRNTRYRPSVYNGKPVGMYFSFRVNYRLEE